VQLPVSGKPQTYEVSFEQQYQQFSGTARVNGRAVKIEGAKLRGDELTFSFAAEVNGAAIKHEFNGRVSGNEMTGQVALSGSRMAARVEWTAERAARTAAIPPVAGERKMVN
jgi:proline racemase